MALKPAGRLVESGEGAIAFHVTLTRIMFTPRSRSVCRVPAGLLNTCGSAWNTDVCVVEAAAGAALMATTLRSSAAAMGILRLMFIGTKNPTTQNR